MGHGAPCPLPRSAAGRGTPVLAGAAAPPPLLGCGIGGTPCFSGCGELMGHSWVTLQCPKGSRRQQGELEPLPLPSLTPLTGRPGTRPAWGTLSPRERSVTGTENSPARNRDAAKRPPDGNGFWIQTSAPEVKGCVLHYQPPESPGSPEICHAHFKPFCFYGQI